MTATKLHGIVDMPADEYHRHEALSSSGAKKLLPPSCPAKFRYERDHGQPPKAEFDFGKAAHKRVLGVGEDVVIIDADNYTTKAAREARDEAYADGKVPILPRENAVIEQMAAAVRSHPIAAALLEPGSGRPEQSLFWDADEVHRRARPDWLPNPTGKRMLLPDYKSANSAAPAEIERAIHAYGYHQQASWYLDAVKALGLAGDDAVFLLIVQEKTAPFLINVVQVDAMALLIGRDLNKQATDIYRECMATGKWPGYAGDEEVPVLGVPRWAEQAYLREEQS